MRSLLKSPAMYQGFQGWLGFAGARKQAFDRYLDIPDGAKVIDVGCGPGNIIRYLPTDIEYHGFDLDCGYIESAQERFDSSYNFYCREFDEAAADEFAPADLVMLNGVLHHMTDEIVESVLRSAKRAIGDKGSVFTLDGCYRTGQPYVTKKLLDMDRGEYVRDELGYATLMNSVFDNVSTYIHEDLSPIPYTFIIMVGKN